MFLECPSPGSQFSAVSLQIGQTQWAAREGETVVLTVTRGGYAKRTPLSVYVRPYAQRALLDGVEVARGEGRVVFRLAPGVPHRIQIEHACCFSFVKDFAAM